MIKTAALPRLWHRLSPWCEFLSLACPQEDLTALNVVDIVDVLDEAGTEGSRYSDGRLGLVDRYAFLPDRLPDDGLFKVPQFVRGATFAVGATAFLLQQEDRGPRLRLEWEG